MSCVAQEFDGMPASDGLVVVRSDGWVTVLSGRVMLARFPDRDVLIRNLTVVSLSHTRFENKAVAKAFGLSEVYVSVLRGRVRDEGSAGLVSERGRPLLIDSNGEAIAAEMRVNGKTLKEIGARLGVDVNGEPSPQTPRRRTGRP